MDKSACEALLVEEQLSGQRIRNPLTRARIAFGTCQHCHQTLDYLVKVFDPSGVQNNKSAVDGNDTVTFQRRPGYKNGNVHAVKGCSCPECKPVMYRGPAQWSPRIMRCKCGRTKATYVYETFHAACERCGDPPSLAKKTAYHDASSKYDYWVCTCGWTTARRVYPKDSTVDIK